MINSIISHKHKYIYLYIPKVACTTIRELLARHEGIKYVPNWTMYGNRVATTKFNYIKYKGGNKYKDYFKFSFVRNPWDRLVSCYADKVVGVRDRPNSFWVRNGNFKPFIHRYKRPFSKMSFDTFANLVIITPDKNSDGHFRSQYTFFENINLDFIGRFENLNADLDNVKRQLGIDLKHGHLWKSKRKRNYCDYYTPELAYLIGKRYEEDIEKFNYRF